MSLVALAAPAGAGPAAASASSPTTTSNFGAPGGKAATTTTVARTATTTVARTGSTTTTVPSTTTTTVSTTTTTFPPGLLAIANSVKRSAPSSTSALLAALAPLEKLGYTAQQAALVGMGQFPVAGPAYYTDDWLEPRPAPPAPHLHMGDDIDAAIGTPIRSPVNGVLTYDDTDPDGYGLAAEVTAPDKTYYVMAHMSSDAAGLHSGSQVTEGEVVGYVGDSGDSTGPHCHFEVHPLGGAGVDPKPYLDAWQAAAVAAAPALIASIEEAQHPTTTTSIAALPLPVALPAQAALPVPIRGALPIRKTAGDSPSGLALVGLIVLLAACTLTAREHRSSSRRDPVGWSPFDSG